ncbi:uncharacterized protein LOC142317713 [Lycorma delicatula]|uniref:uncharacterized protein LOC142317713 n=1 Tax=Lycorma delicatula TaxID=130591 RepID=UPI003F519585
MVYQGNEKTVNPSRNLTFLDYSNKNFEGLPKFLENEIYLQELYMKHNCLQNIPIWISKLENLTDLSIYDNCLVDLPDEIGLLTNLKCLDIGRNCLTSLPRTIKNLMKLNFLAIENNLLTEIPDEIGCLKNLIVLQLSNNRLEKIPLTLAFCKSLYALHLERNNLRKMANNLTLLPNLEFLTVCHNQLLYLPSLPFTRKIHLDFSQNSYLNYVSYSFYLQQISFKLCDRFPVDDNTPINASFNKEINTGAVSEFKNSAPIDKSVDAMTDKKSECFPEAINNKIYLSLLLKVLSGYAPSS